MKQRLDQLAGLTKLSFSAYEVDAGLGRPSFRDMSAFTFQPQNIVAILTSCFTRRTPSITVRSCERFSRMSWGRLQQTFSRSATN